jgi:hypothetical protein
MSTFALLPPDEAVAASGSTAPGHLRIDGLKGVDADRIPNVIPEEPWRAHAHLDKFKIISRVGWAEDADPGTAEVFYTDGSTELIKRDDLLCVERPITTPEEDKEAMKDESLPIEARRAAFRRHNARQAPKETAPAAADPKEDGRTTMVSERTALKAAAEVAELRSTLEGWQERNPMAADYRVTESLQHLRRVSVLLGYLVTDTDPEGDEARAKLKASGFFD